MKPKLYILVGLATHFLKWELAWFRESFDLVSQPSNDAVLLAFGPDVLASGATLPALKRIAYLFPGFGYNPYHNLECRVAALSLIESCYDLVFLNPGPLEVAYKASQKIVSCPFSIDTRALPFRGFRRSLKSLLHVSADYPHKDWKRSACIMELTGLRHEIYPPRNPTLWQKRQTRLVNRVKHLTNRILAAVGTHLEILPYPYVSHRAVIRRYLAYDGFVHVAGEIIHPYCIDGKYTACLMEAGATGAILFWHDTFGLGCDLETVFCLSLDAEKAAREILEIRSGLDVVNHSRRTQEEIHDRFSPKRSVGFRCAKIYELLEEKLGP